MALSFVEITNQMIPLPTQNLLDVIAGAHDGDLVDAERFRLGLLAAAGLHQHIIKFVPEFLNRMGSLDVTAGIKVDVVLHLVKGVRIAGDLDDRHDRVAKRRSASC